MIGRKNNSYVNACILDYQVPCAQRYGTRCLNKRCWTTDASPSSPYGPAFVVYRKVSKKKFCRYSSWNSHKDKPNTNQPLSRFHTLMYAILAPKPPDPSWFFSQVEGAWSPIPRRAAVSFASTALPCESFNDIVLEWPELEILLLMHGRTVSELDTNRAISSWRSCSRSSARCFVIIDQSI